MQRHSEGRGKGRPHRATGRRSRAAARTTPGEIVEAIVAHIGAHGDGVATTAHGRLYIPLTVPGDRVLTQKVSPRGDGYGARLVDILAPGPARAAPACAHFGTCGGCALQHLTDHAYERWKVEKLTTALARAGVADCEIAPVRRSPPHRRRRAVVSLLRGEGRRAEAMAGFKVKQGHAIVDIVDCAVLDPAITGVLPALRRLTRNILRPGQRGHAVVTLLEHGLDVVMEWPEAPGLDQRERLAAFAYESDVARVSWQPAADTAAEPVVQRRPASLTLGGAVVDVPPGGFVQPCPEAQEALTAAVVEAGAGAAAICDLFAGVGTFTFPLAGTGARVHAVEGDGDALRSLARAAPQMQSRGAGVSWAERDLERRPLTAAELDRFDAVAFDPPRAGARAQCEELARSRVPRLIAVSCNPQTFARDVRILCQGGYRLDRVTPVDQFLWTPHLEVVGVLHR